MRLARFTNYLLAHRWQTLLLAFVITNIPVIGVLGILIAALVTLRKGILEGAMVTIAASLPFVLTPVLFGQNYTHVQLLVVWIGVGFAILSNVLSWIFAVMLNRQASWSMVLQVAALLGVLIVSVIHLADPSIADWWGEKLLALQSFYGQLAVSVSGIPATGAAAAVPTQPQLDNINALKEIATGVMVAGVFSQAIFQLILACWWQAAVYNPGSLRVVLHNIRLSRLASILFILTLVLSYFANSVVLDIMPILYMLFVAAGLSLTHYLIGLLNSPTVWFWLTLLYIMLIFSLIFAMPMLIVFISTMAMLDAWLDIRKRVKKV